jgi:hypothetical protein
MIEPDVTPIDSGAFCYLLVVQDWQRVVDVGRLINRSPSAVRAGVHREFRRRYPDAWRRLVDLMADRQASRDRYWRQASVPVPYLWMLRAYEKWRVIPRRNEGEGMSKCRDSDELMAAWKVGWPNPNDDADVPESSP